jgi:hypothetical protein
VLVRTVKAVFQDSFIRSFNKALMNLIFFFLYDTCAKSVVFHVCVRSLIKIRSFKKTLINSTIFSSTKLVQKNVVASSSFYYYFIFCKIPWFRKIQRLEFINIQKLLQLCVYLNIMIPTKRSCLFTFCS